MKKKVFKVSVCAVFVVLVSMFLAFSVLAADTSCKTKYPIILAHGMGFYPTSTLPNSFPGIAEALRACGATVYVTQVEPLGTSAEKAVQFVNGYKFNGVTYGNFKGIKAATGAAKFNIIGHSQGGLYTRYAISNLGIAPYVASLTTADSPHRGSLIDTITALQGKLMPDMATKLMAAVNPYNYAYLANATGDSIATVAAKAQANQTDLSVENMTLNFNPGAPNKAGVYYQSFSCAYKVYTPLKSTLAGLEQIIALYTNSLPKQPNPADGMAIANFTQAGMQNYASTCFQYGGGLGDGLVQVDSAKWGNYLGTQFGPWYNAKGLNHFDAININKGATWNAVGYYVQVVKDLKAKGF